MKILVTVMLIAGFLAGCNSNKKGARSYGKKKGYNYSAHAARPSPHTNSNKSLPDTTVFRSNIADTTINVLEENPYYRERPGTNFQGASGVGTGGSYASSYYRQESMKKKKKDMYKNRNFDHLYQDENTTHLVPPKDSVDVSPKDSTGVIVSDTTALEW